MAFATDDDEEKKAQAPDVNALTGEGAPAPSSGGASQAPATPAPQGQGGGGNDFVNFDQYYNANAGAAQNTANQLASNATQTATNATNDINQASTDFDRAVHGTKTPSFPTGTATQATPSATPKTRTATGGTPTVIDDFSPNAPPMPGQTGVYKSDAEKLAKAQYTGPGSLLDAQFGGQKLQDSVQHAGQQVDALQTPEGIQAALHGGQGGVSNALDAALVNRAGGGQFRALKDKYGSLTKLLDDRVNSSAEAGNQARAGAATQAGKYQTALDTYEKQAKGRAAIQPSIEEARAAGNWPPKTPSAASAMVAAAGPWGPIMQAAIEIEQARERDAIAHPENYPTDSTAVIKTSGTKLPGTRD